MTLAECHNRHPKRLKTEQQPVPVQPYISLSPTPWFTRQESKNCEGFGLDDGCLGRPFRAHGFDLPLNPWRCHGLGLVRPDGAQRRAWSGTAACPFLFRVTVFQKRFFVITEAGKSSCLRVLRAERGVIEKATQCDATLIAAEIPPPTDANCFWSAAPNQPATSRLPSISSVWRFPFSLLPGSAHPSSRKAPCRPDFSDPRPMNQRLTNSKPSSWRSRANQAVPASTMQHKTYPMASRSYWFSCAPLSQILPVLARSYAHS